jgi:hypothetical protein
MAKPVCPVCGDPGPFELWQTSNEPPVECPYNPAAKSVTDCEHQMGKAWQSAEFRRLVPDAFDENGNIKPGRAADVLRAFVNAHPDKALRLG